jgi:hypothetical protein
MFASEYSKKYDYTQVIHCNYRVIDRIRIFSKKIYLDEQMCGYEYEVEEKEKQNALLYRWSLHPIYHLEITANSHPIPVAELILQNSYYVSTTQISCEIDGTFLLQISQLPIGSF